MALIIGTDLQAALGASASELPLLNLLASGASQAVKSYLKYDPESSPETITLTGTGSPWLVLPRLPVTAVASVNVDPFYVFGASTLLTADVDYHVDWISTGLCKTGKITLLTTGSFAFGSFYTPFAAGPSYYGLTGYGATRAAWPTSPGCIQVTYTAGYAATPDDMKQATVAIGCWMYRSQPWGGLTPSGSYIDVSVSLQAAVEALASGSAPLIGASRQILNSYRDIPTGGGGP